MSDCPQLRMLHPDLTKLPQLILPDGIAVHTEYADSPAVWEEIIDDSFGSHHNYDETMRTRPGYRPEGVFFASLNGVDCATAAAVEKTEFPGYGWIHMVGVRSSARGHGLGRIVVHAALLDMAARGFTKAGLTTDDFRIPAICTYLSLGFEPAMDHESYPERWKKIYEIIGK